MRTVGVRELKTNTTQILRRIREKGETIQVTYRGKVIAMLIPAPNNKSAPDKSTRAVWTDLDHLAAEISARWPADVSAVDAVRDVRRDL